LKWWPGAEWNAGFASSHNVRLSALCASVELPTRGFSEKQVVNSIHIYQSITGASVAQFSSPGMTMHS